MIDVGLLASIAIVLIVPSVFVPPWPTSAAVMGLFETAGGALMIGLVVGRLTSVAIDDPGSLTRISDLMIIRSGVEFWPGVVAGMAWIALRSNHDHIAPAQRLAALTAPALVAWACFEATCLIRDGCPGPLSNVGLRPDGLVQRMLPVGVLAAATAVGAAIATRHFHRRGMPNAQVVALALALLAVIRSVASIWLPRIGEGLTRQHKTSLAVAVIASASFVAIRVLDRRATALAER